MELNEKRTIRWYEIIYVLVLIVLLGFSVLFMNPHKVAVLDIDRVFKELGMPQKIEKDRAKLDAFVKGSALLQAYNTRMNALKEKLDAARTQIEKDKIQAQVKAANAQFQESLAPIQASLQSYEAGVVATFRRRLQPFVAKAAQKRKVDIVMYAGPNLLYVRSKADLTDDVIKESKAMFEKDMQLIDPALGGKPSPRK
jgi:Skp family chaperone for outer membrane proteins